MKKRMKKTARFPDFFLPLQSFAMERTSRASKRFDWRENDSTGQRLLIENYTPLLRCETGTHRICCRAESSALTRDAPAIRNSKTESCQALRFAFLGRN
jgi:hypothetical protein